MTLSSRHRIRNLSPGGLRPSTLPLCHGGSPQYWLSHVDREETFKTMWISGYVIMPLIWLKMAMLVYYIISQCQHVALWFQELILNICDMIVWSILYNISMSACGIMISGIDIKHFWHGILKILLLLSSPDLPSQWHMVVISLGDVTCYTGMVVLLSG